MAMTFLLRKFLLPALAGSLLLVSQASAEPDRARLREVLGRVERAMEGTGARGDVIFFLHQGARLTGRKLNLFLADDVLAFRELNPIEAGAFELWRMAEKPMPTLSKAVLIKPDPEVGQSNSVLSKEQELAWVISIMTKAVGCKTPVGLSDLVGDPYYGLVVANQVLTGLIARSRGCVSDADFANSYPKYVTRMYSEMLLEEQERMDLHVERMALLGLLGRIDLVPEPMLERLLSAQMRDGFWYYEIPRDYSTALAYLAISAAYGREQAPKP